MTNLSSMKAGLLSNNVLLFRISIKLYKHKIVESKKCLKRTDLLSYTIYIMKLF